MHTSQKRSGLISGLLLPLGLICLFAMCSLALALLGGRAYKTLNQDNAENFSGAVVASYLRTKLAQNNSVDAVSVQQFGDTEVLVIRTGDSFDYEIHIFVRDGYLVEAYVPASDAFNPTLGERIAPVTSCSFAISSSGLFTAEIVTPQGQSMTMAFALIQGGVL